MRKPILLIVLAFIVLMANYCSSTKLTGVEKLSLVYTNYVDSFYAVSQQFNNIVQENATDSNLIRWHFRNYRIAYKKIELFVDYYYPSTAKAINGPALFEVEAENPAKPNPPSGFQVLEEKLFPFFDTGSITLMKEQAALMESLALRLKASSTTLAFTDQHFFDILKTSIIRIETMGITGFDTPILQSAIKELQVSLEALRDYTNTYTKEEDSNKALLRLSFAIDYLKSNHSFDDFDRAFFITEFLNPLSNDLALLQQKLNIPYFNESRPLHVSATTIFDRNAWNAWFYSPIQKDVSNKQMIALGEKLFYDNRLSLNQTRSCASCHQANKAFTDGKIKSKSFDGKKLILRNTPTILYAGLQPLQFADSRLVYLEDQAKQVIENPNELHGNLKIAALVLQKDQLMQDQFLQSYKDSAISPGNIQTAIAAFIRSKSVFNTPFDQYMRGNKKAMSDEAVKGFNLFMGKAKCGTCHFMPLFNGVVPPHFNTMESEVIGVPSTNKSPYTLDADSGKYSMYQSMLHLHAFKTPTIRNASKTAPYMHNGVYADLQSVLDFYNKGGGKGLGINVTNQTLPSNPLNLSTTEIQAIIQFIETLTDQ
ncbi:MAG: cytochrome-c peroxidase [Sphingobacteriia bacterium]|nr:MAG: cytochrome-c peroxidase [Sphingobacteriia bacterium]